MTRVAIPDWCGHVSPVFDVATRALVVDVEGGLETHRKVVLLAGFSPAGRVRQLEALGVDTLVCGAISRQVEGLAGTCGIRVIALVSGPVDTVAQIVAQGRPIPDTCLLPGCREPRIQPARGNR
jgi:predicted Fe-Mo cluster-binding NifX family protein